jgi:type IV pilus assembly protein PilA
MNAHRKNQGGFSLIELLIVVTIILIIAAIAIPKVLNAKIQTNEAAAVVTLHTLNANALMYSNSYGTFPHQLSDLGPAGGGSGPSSTSADLIDSTLATGTKAGYVFTFTVTGTDSAGNVISYSISATPVKVGTTGQRSFYTDLSDTIHASQTGVADSSSPPLG